MTLPSFFLWESQGYIVVAGRQLGVKVNDVWIRFECFRVYAIITLVATVRHDREENNDHTHMPQRKVQMVCDSTTNINSNRVEN